MEMYSCHSWDAHRYSWLSISGALQYLADVCSDVGHIASKTRKSSLALFAEKFFPAERRELSVVIRTAL